MPVIGTHFTVSGRTAVGPGRLNWQTVCKIAIPAQHTYCGIAMGTFGDFTGIVPLGYAAQTKVCLLDSNLNNIDESFAPFCGFHQGALIGGTPAFGQERGMPFFKVVQFTAGPTAAYFAIQVHVGDAAGGTISDACLWLWDRTDFAATTMAVVDALNSAHPQYPSFGSQVSVATPTFGTAADLYFVAWSCEVLAPDRQFGYHTRLRKQSDNSILMGGDAISTDHSGIGNLGLLAPSGDRYTMGGFRTFTLAAGDTLHVDFARPAILSGGMPGPASPKRAAIFIAKVELLDDSIGLYTTNLASFVGASSPGTPSPMNFVPNTFTGLTPFLFALSAGLPNTASIIGSARIHASLDGNFARAGDNGLFNLHFPSPSPFVAKFPYPQQSLLLVPGNPNLGNTGHTLTVVGMGNPNEFGVGGRRGYDVAQMALSAGTQLILAAPVESTPGPDVYLQPGVEAPRLGAIEEVPFAASYVEELELDLSPVNVRYDDGHAGGWSQQMVSGHHRRIHWDALKREEWTLQVKPIVETRTGHAFQLSVDGEAAPRVFTKIGALSRHAIVAPNPVGTETFSVAIDAVELVLVGP